MGNKNFTIIIKIISYINKINQYAASVEKSDFLADTKLVDACVFNLLQIGELANRFDESFRKNYENVPWHKMRGLRNRIVHDYEGVNIELVWDIIKNDLSVLQKQLEEIK